MTEYVFVQKRKILITNDDGYNHCGHLSLKKILQNLGHEVWSIAPQENQSGAGMKLTLGKSLEFQQLDSRSWACSGTPVDCVLFALHGILDFRPDVVISGINAGANLSDDIWYSGTAAAAREASKWGVPGLALSYSVDAPSYKESDFAIFGTLLQQHFGDLSKSCELKEGRTGQNFAGFLNINIPVYCNGQIRLARCFEQRVYQNILEKVGENRYVLSGGLDNLAQYSASTDTAIDTMAQVSISLGAFHALQPLSYPMNLPNLPSPECSNTSDELDTLAPLCFAPSEEACRAMARIVASGIK